MASNYEAICEENRRGYGTEIGRIGRILLADRYDDRTHFIFELLQNAEDALSRRESWRGPRKVSIELSAATLKLTHFGKPFDEADVRGICGIAESTKGTHSIGRFGIGFKSVYTFTDRPEIHSGNEDFAVENYVLPKRTNRTERDSDATEIILPLNAKDEVAQLEITSGLRRLGPGALLFLRHIDEINWKVEGGASGVYLRSKPELIGGNVRRITVIGQETGQPDVDQSWLVFERDVHTETREKIGFVEVAFLLRPVKDLREQLSIEPVADSPLVVFFPTVVSTNLGFLVQGPYRTTPSRDNIPRGEAWNQYLVQETAGLLVEALRWMRDKALLDASALRCLPLDREKFSEGTMFTPIFDAVRQAFLEERLLPRFDGGYVSAGEAKLARTQELRELFSPEQVAVLFGSEGAAWLTGEITPDREPAIRQYLMQELGIAEITPAILIPRLERRFLEAQPDDWVLRLYEYLSGQEAVLRHRLGTIPLLRLEDGTHVVAKENGKPMAFLPSEIETGFPTMRRAVCSSAEARSFLISLGITQPDPVDDVVWNVLPKYKRDDVEVSEEVYAADVGRIVAAFSTDSKAQREKLLAELRQTDFVMVLDSADGKGYLAKPGEIYIATDRLKQLFAGVPDVLVVDDQYDCLRGENIRELLEACGALRYPRPVDAPNALTSAELAALRRQTGHEVTSGINDRVVDWELAGFEALIQLLPKLALPQRAERARLIWESLGDLEERRGRAIFEGAYSWTHYGEYKAPSFQASFLRRLNREPWLPNSDGDLVRPGLVVFSNLGWKANPFLLSKISFKPPIIDQLAKEAGIDPAAIDLLRKLGITSVADLTTRLGILDVQPEPTEGTNPDGATARTGDDDVYGDAEDLYGDDMPDIPPGTPDPEGGDDATAAGGVNGTGRPGQSASPGAGGHKVGLGGGSNRNIAGDGKGGGTPGQGGQHPNKGRGRPFISYVGAHPDGEGPDPDGLDAAARMQVEEHAIAFIAASEPALRRTAGGNPGFDLYEVDSSGLPSRWVEVKSMTGSLEDRPVGLSRTQFDYAREKGEAFWLYVVEYAADPAKSRVLRIRNPARLARTFTFDQGWRQIAEIKPESQETK